jgi:hypothetical protein
MRTIRWTQPTESGLCDRLYDLHFLSAYARVLNHRLHTKWEKFDLKPIDTPHRKLDILIENVRAHINFPEEIVIDDGTAPCDCNFTRNIGAAANYQDLWKMHAESICSWDVFNAALKETGKGFTFCPEINAVLAALPERFCAVHIRRGDKVRDTPHDGCMIETHELDRLDELTFRAIDYAAEAFASFFVCGDEDEKLKPFVEHIRKIGGEIISIPQREKWRMTYYDLAVMTKSSFNITSQRRSTFSSFPALIGKGHFRTVYDLELDGLI